MQDLEPDTDQPCDHCALRHEMFSKLGPISFRRAETDGTPMMILPFGEREAGVPLRSLQLAFNIGDETPDGRMLGLIAESLDFITSLSPGDKLPAEVVDGGASWEPARRHRQAAATRLQLQLLAWIDPAAARRARQGGDIEGRLETDPGVRARVQAAFREVAAALALESPAAAVALVERVGEEFAYIEALRDRLLGRVQGLAGRLGGYARSAVRLDDRRREAITQAQRLLGTALAQFRGRFEELDAQTGEIIATLRNADSQIAYIRSNRDTLYRSLRAWEPMLDQWVEAEAAGGGSAWAAIGEIYHFLARRYLPANEWPVLNSIRQAGAPPRPEHSMVW